MAIVRDARLGIFLTALLCAIIAAGELAAYHGDFFAVLADLGYSINLHLQKSSPEERAKILSGIVGSGCVARDAYYEGDGDKKGLSSGDGFWSTHCEDGRSFEIQLKAHGEPYVASCDEVRRVTGKESCFVAVEHLPDPAPAPMAASSEIGAGVKITKVRTPSDDRAFAAIVFASLLKKELDDPSSLEWVQVLVNDRANVVCATFRARNGFNALRLQHVSMVELSLHNDAQTWNRNCAGTPLNDETFAAKNAPNLP